MYLCISLHFCREIPRYISHVYLPCSFTSAFLGIFAEKGHLRGVPQQICQDLPKVRQGVHNTSVFSAKMARNAEELFSLHFSAKTLSVGPLYMEHGLLAGNKFLEMSMKVVSKNFP